MQQTMRALRWAGALLVLACTAQAEDAASSAASASAAPVSDPAAHVLAANTEVHLRLLAPVASNTHKHGDHFPLEVVDPVVVDGMTVIPAGAKGEGEVVHAQKAGFGGRGGELILASRFVNV